MLRCLALTLSWGDFGEWCFYLICHIVYGNKGWSHRRFVREVEGMASLLSVQNMPLSFLTTIVMKLQQNPNSFGLFSFYRLYVIASHELKTRVMNDLSQSEWHLLCQGKLFYSCCYEVIIKLSDGTPQVLKLDSEHQLKWLCKSVCVLSSLTVMRNDKLVVGENVFKESFSGMSILIKAIQKWKWRKWNLCSWKTII